MKKFMLIKVIIITSLSFLIVIFSLTVRKSIKFKNHSVNDIIDSIKYTRQGYPYVYVNSEYIDLTEYSNAANSNIQVGDSLSKFKGIRTIYFVREKNDSVIKFKLEYLSLW